MTDGTASSNDGDIGQEPTTLLVDILETLTEQTGADPLELPPLYESVDPEALAELVGTSGARPLTVSFDHAGHRIEVDGAGEVAVDPASD